MEVAGPKGTHTHKQTNTQRPEPHINRMPFTLPLSLLYWHRDENKSMQVPEGHGTGGEGHLPATFNITTHCSHILCPKIICRSSFDVWAGIAAGKIFIPSRMWSGRLCSLAFKLAFYLHFDIYAPQGMNPNIYHSPWTIRMYFCIVSKFEKKNTSPRLGVSFTLGVALLWQFWSCVFSFLPRFYLKWVLLKNDEGDWGSP